MSKEWLNNIKISQELKDKIYYDEKNDLWVISWNAVGEALERAKKVEELLELYQKRFSFYSFDEDKDLREIKQLEKELDKDV